MLFHAGTLDETYAPKRGKRYRRSRELAIYLLTPGFSQAYHAQTLGVSCNTVRKHLAWSRAFALGNPAILEAVELNVTSITPEDGVRMAQRRGSTHLPWWSRLAIAQFAAGMRRTSEVAALFRCSLRTVQHVLTRGSLSYDLFTGVRRPSLSQVSPPGRWKLGMTSEKQKTAGR